MALSAGDRVPRLGQYLYGSSPSAERLPSIHSPIPLARALARAPLSDGVGATGSEPRTSSIGAPPSPGTRNCRHQSARKLPVARNSASETWWRSKQSSITRLNERLVAIRSVGA